MSCYQPTLYYYNEMIQDSKNASAMTSRTSSVSTAQSQLPAYKDVVKDASKYQVTEKEQQSEPSTSKSSKLASLKAFLKPDPETTERRLRVRARSYGYVSMR